MNLAIGGLQACFVREGCTSGCSAGPVLTWSRVGGARARAQGVAVGGADAADSAPVCWSGLSPLLPPAAATDNCCRRRSLDAPTYHRCGMNPSLNQAIHRSFINHSIQSTNCCRCMWRWPPSRCRQMYPCCRPTPCPCCLPMWCVLRFHRRCWQLREANDCYCCRCRCCLCRCRRCWARPLRGGGGVRIVACMLRGRAMRVEVNSFTRFNSWFVHCACS